jgi:type I restriction enzyme S subunit
MQRLFTYGPGPEPASTKETEIGEIPEHWEVVQFGQLVDSGPQNGLYKPASYYGDGVPILRIDAFDAGDVIGAQKLKRVRLSNSETEKYALSEGDFVINRVNGSLEILGKCALVGQLLEPTVFESNMIRFGVDTKRVLNGFLLQFLCTAQAREQIRRKARIIHQASINQQDLKSLFIALPILPEQEEIAHQLAAADRKIEAEEQRKAALQSLFKAMLHQLMTGQLRLCKSGGCLQFNPIGGSKSGRQN